MVRKLHSSQKKLVEILSEHIDNPLTIRELQSLIGASSTSVVAHHLKQLEKKGYLKRNINNPQDYCILRGTPEKPIAYLNIYGLVDCGPRGSILDGNPVDKIPVPTRLITFPANKGFVVKARGDSMSPKINDGDLLIAQKKDTADNGETVVCVNNGEALVKKIKKGKETILISLNPKYEPFVAAEDFRIEGIVKGIYSSQI